MSKLKRSTITTLSDDRHQQDDLICTNGFGRCTSIEFLVEHGTKHSSCNLARALVDSITPKT